MKRLILAAVMALGACDEEPELQLGPPRCEPARELEHERALKVGFRAILEGDLDKAKASFQQVENEEPGHPEAALGLRLSGKRLVVPPSKPSGAQGARREVVIAGQPFDMPVDVVTERYRFEDLAALKRVRTGGDVALYQARSRSGQAVDAHDADAVRAAVELVVLYDTKTTTLVERVVALEGQGGATHFIVDWDGTIYQTLDLAWTPNGGDGRAITVELVNPVSLETSPVLPDGSTRTKSPLVRLNGREQQHWGYTEAQLVSLERLVQGLLGLFPQVQRRVPTDAIGGVPRGVIGPDAFSGIAGHLHISRGAADPGAAFPWERIQRLLTP